MKKILIVEDDQLVANIYRNKFAVEGFTVEVASNGETGFNLVKSFRPDVVILDLILPRLSGVDLMKKIRAEAGCEKLPLIVFSNTYLSNLVQEAWKAGATKCLSKANCSPKEVVEAVRATLGQVAEPAAKTYVAEPRAKLGGAQNDAAKAEAGFQTEMRRSFGRSFAEIVTGLRNSIKALAKTGTDAERLVHTQAIYHRIHGLTGAASLAGLTELAQLSEALEAFTMELHEKPSTISA